MLGCCNTMAEHDKVQLLKVHPGKAPASRKMEQIGLALLLQVQLKTLDLICNTNPTLEGGK